MTINARSHSFLLAQEPLRVEERLNPGLPCSAEAFDHVDLEVKSKYCAQRIRWRWRQNLSVVCSHALRLTRAAAREDGF